MLSMFHAKKTYKGNKTMENLLLTLTPAEKKFFKLVKPIISDKTDQQEPFYLTLHITENHISFTNGKILITVKKPYDFLTNCNINAQYPFDITVNKNFDVFSITSQFPVVTDIIPDLLNDISLSDATPILTEIQNKTLYYNQKNIKVYNFSLYDLKINSGDNLNNLLVSLSNNYINQNLIDMFFAFLNYSKQRNIYLITKPENKIILIPVDNRKDDYSVLSFAVMPYKKHDTRKITTIY